MFLADGLLILQASNCNHQIPAKLYEYFRIGRPILALTDKNGDTAKTMLEANLTNIAPLDNAERIAEELLLFLNHLITGNTKVARGEVLQNYSRKMSSLRLGKLFDETIHYCESNSKSSSMRM